ncbi:AraC family transcriptional regulator [Psychromonas aquimarina]|uniref:AraC family transcriptional regulator n=1 Tax=Psychromonas aquimarina TaxID=444919 RepID=UPI0003F6D541|nr:AraC family transcriptional regulator [Psychromonas aquimarina]
MLNRLSIRSYTSQMRGHFHDYHQLVLPLHGSIEIKVGDYKGIVSLGDCVIIKAGQRHDFRANEAARFIVADIDSLPDKLLTSTADKFPVNAPLLAYLQFIEKQLEYQVHQSLEDLSFELFYQLLIQQEFSLKVDPRIERVIELLNQDLSQTYHIEMLAKTACLSTTQYKKVFKQCMGSSTQKYITQLRMEKAKALLTHTDLPVRIVAEQVGYHDLSAFSRRFSSYFGQSPKAFSR